MEWKFSAIAPLVALLALGCFELRPPPDGARIRCDDEGARCPEPWQCCDGWCSQQCAAPACDGGPSCGLTHAVDCESERICLGGCWASCPGCGALCADTSLKRCQAALATETWLCRQQETCVVRDSQELIADCHMAPPQCQGSEQASCTCLTGPSALYPPCRPQETCLDSTSSCVICRYGVDAGPGVRGDAGDFEAGPLQYDAGSGGDIVRPLDYDASWQDPDAMSIPAPDGGTDWDAGDDTRESPAVGAFDDFNGGLAQDPVCFPPLGAGPAGAFCCAEWAEYADVGDGVVSCPGDTVAPTGCDGYGEACLQGQVLDCDLEDSCVWIYEDESGLITCADYGPNVPCFSGYWSCVAGTTHRSSCP